MVDSKKKFIEPEIKAVEIEQADIICTSGINAQAEFGEWEVINL